MNSANQSFKKKNLSFQKIKKNFIVHWTNLKNYNSFTCCLNADIFEDLKLTALKQIQFCAPKTPFCSFGNFPKMSQNIKKIIS